MHTLGECPDSTFALPVTTNTSADLVSKHPSIASLPRLECLAQQDRLPVFIAWIVLKAAGPVPLPADTLLWSGKNFHQAGDQGQPHFVVHRQVPVLLASISLLCSCSALLCWKPPRHLPTLPVPFLGLTLSFQPPHFAVLAKVMLTHKQMCGQVGGEGGATYPATSHNHTAGVAGVPVGDLGEGPCPVLSLGPPFEEWVCQERYILGLETSGTIWSLSWGLTQRGPRLAKLRT